MKQYLTEKQNSSLTGGGRLREVVARRELTVIRIDRRRFIKMGTPIGIGALGLRCGDFAEFWSNLFVKLVVGTKGHVTRGNFSCNLSRNDDD